MLSFNLSQPSREVVYIMNVFKYLRVMFLSILMVACPTKGNLSRKYFFEIRNRYLRNIFIVYVLHAGQKNNWYPLDHVFDRPRMMTKRTVQGNNQAITNLYDAVVTHWMIKNALNKDQGVSKKVNLFQLHEPTRLMKRKMK